MGNCLDCECNPELRGALLEATLVGAAVDEAPARGLVCCSVVDKSCRLLPTGDDARMHLGLADGSCSSSVPFRLERASLLGLLEAVIVALLASGHDMPCAPAAKGVQQELIFALVALLLSTHVPASGCIEGRVDLNVLRRMGDQTLALRIFQDCPSTALHRRFSSQLALALITAPALLAAAVRTLARFRPVSLSTAGKRLLSCSCSWSPERKRHSRAYCSLLHGSDNHFFVYALILGFRLKILCPDADRVLLCAGRWWKDRAARTALSCVYTCIRHVQLIHAPKASSVARHNRVFSKIQALRLPYRKLVFLDLDLVPRADLSALFDVQAPAGMHHGDRRSGKPLQHGQPIAPECDGWWCVNAGVLRLDPGPTRQARRQNVASLVDDVRRIRWPTALPEQYFLAGRMEGWRHLDPRWNMEVGPHYDDPGFTWPRTQARQASAVPRGQLWLGQAVEDVRVFHFSGTKLHPWWYVDLSPQAAFDEASALWYHRDPRRLIATAIFEWRLALDATMTAAASWPIEAQQSVYAALRRLREDALALGHGLGGGAHDRRSVTAAATGFLAPRVDGCWDGRDGGFAPTASLAIYSATKSLALHSVGHVGGWAVVPGSGSIVNRGGIARLASLLPVHKRSNCTRPSSCGHMAVSAVTAATA
eukprot:CAMPEP_0172808686 /NCGR_PEP_ID=MMETSP1075-20121228/7836_1 /TAXON_ID=2916 /ORGANISM="Ceratium fusus, Strain PA161109" /LENGTH=650 /DNA_ID=CAMNT_0013647869 /DNA_START=83 /DNA_END=2033 /DNA_ORIENTATION=-